MIYPCFSRSVCFSMGSPAWWRFGLCSSGSSLVFRWRDAPLVREFQMWRRRCKQIDPHWFQGIKFVSSDYVQQYPGYISWYIGSDCLVQQFFNHSPPASYFQQFTGSCYSLWVTGCDIEISLDMLWIGVDCIFKKRIFSMYWSISFLNYKYLIQICITFLYAQLANTSPSSYFDPKYFVCSIARISRGRFVVEAGRFLSKQGVSTIIKHSPSCYNFR